MECWNNLIYHITPVLQYSNFNTAIDRTYESLMFGTMRHEFCALNRPAGGYFPCIDATLKMRHESGRQDLCV